MIKTDLVPDLTKYIYIYILFGGGGKTETKVDEETIISLQWMVWRKQGREMQRR